MPVTISPQLAIAAGDTDWAAEAEANRVKANQNDTNLKTAVELLQAAVPVQKIKSGATTYSPDANGLVTLPSGVVAPATTTTERDAIASPTIGQLIYNTTNARLELYSATGWNGVGSLQIDVFVASGTWTKPANAKVCIATVIGGGGGGSVKKNNVSSVDDTMGGSGGAWAQRTILAAALPATVPVTVGSGGAPGSVTANGSANGNDGSASTFGSLLAASGGKAGYYSGFNGNYRPGGQPLYPNAPETQGQTVIFEYGEGGNSNLGGGQNAPLGAGGGGAGASNQAVGQSRPGGLGSTSSANQTRNGGGVTGGGLPGATSAAQTVAITGSTPTSKSGTGLAGDGGPGASAGFAGVATGTVIGGPGGIPGGGGGGALFNHQGTSGFTVTGGAGARGEVVVITLF